MSSHYCVARSLKKEKAVNEQLPMFDRAMNMWKEIDFLVQDEEVTDLSAYLNCLRDIYGNGTVMHKTFSVPEHPDFMDFVSRGALHSAYFFERFWRARSVSSVLPFELRELNFYSTDLFRWIHAVELPGSLASTLVRGGAYGQGVPPARKAMELATAAAEAMLGGDFENTQVFIAHEAWSSFFCDVAWDYTCLVVQPDRRRIEVILATDTD